MATNRKKLVVVGDKDCGKSTLVITYIRDEFPTVCVPTTFDNNVADIEVDGEQIQLVIWNISGQEDYESFRYVFYLDTDIVIICFSICSPDSLKNAAEKWAPEVQRFIPNAPVLLVGNKKDLRDDEDTNEQHVVSFNEGSEVAQSIDAAAYVECSAKTQDGVREVFESAARFAFGNKKQNNCCW